MTDTLTSWPLQQRCLKLGWRLSRERGEYVLYGNGSPAAFTSEKTLILWLEKQEQAVRRTSAPEQLEMDLAA